MIPDDALRWFGMPVVVSELVPPGTCFVMGAKGEPQTMYVSRLGRRNRWWWKPWTWLRTNDPSPLDTIRSAQ